MAVKSVMCIFIFWDKEIIRISGSDRIYFLVRLSKIKLKLIVFVWNRILSICRFVMDTVSKSPISVKFMHISIADDIKKRFHAACAIRGLKMSQVITELVEQWLKTNETSLTTQDSSRRN